MYFELLGGNCHTKLLACIWPCSEHMWETLSTLRFASRMKNVETNPVRNRLNAQHNNENGSGSSNGQGINRQLQLQVEALKKELAMRDFIHIQKNNNVSHGGYNGSVAGSMNGGNSGSSGVPPSIPTVMHNAADNSWLHELTRGQQQASSRTCLQHVLQAQQTQWLDHVPVTSEPLQQEENSVPLFSETALMPLLLNMQSPSHEQQQRQHLLEELQRINSNVQSLSSGLPMHSLAQAQHTVQILMRALTIACAGPHCHGIDSSAAAETSAARGEGNTVEPTTSASSSSRMTVPKAMALAIASWHLPAAFSSSSDTAGNHSGNSVPVGNANSTSASTSHPHGHPGPNQHVRFLQEICNLAGLALPSSPTSPVVSGPSNRTADAESNGDADDVQTSVHQREKQRPSKAKQSPLLSPQEQQQAKEEAFRSFTSAAGAGHALQRRYDEALEGLKAAKTRQKEIVVYLNTNKTAIDRYTQALHELQQQQQQRHKGDNDDADEDNTEVNGSEASQLTAQQIEEQQVLLDESKRNYRVAYQELQLCKAQIEEVQSLKQRALTAVLQAFNAYYAQLQGDDEDDENEDDDGNAEEAGK